MKYSAHNLLKSQEGFSGYIAPSSEAVETLKSARREIRHAVRQAFRTVSNALTQDNTGKIFLNEKALPNDLTQRILKLQPNQKLGLKQLTPRFATQGSFAYGTMVSPCRPPQQMDLDDGIYLPIEIFEKQPFVTKDLFFYIVDRALEVLTASKHNWRFVGDHNKCPRIIIGNDIHVDTPLYAIPKDKFQQMLENVAVVLSYNKDATPLRQYLDSDQVYLALRHENKWIPSDPAKIMRWFENSSTAIGGQGLAKRLSKYFKAWRDYHFTVGGPSSIALMACAVNSLSKANKQFKDDSEALLYCLQQLPIQLEQGVKNPASPDQTELFPVEGQSPEEKICIINNAQRFFQSIKQALLHSNSRDDVVREFHQTFGPRLPLNIALVASSGAAAVMAAKPKAQPQEDVGNMQGG